MTSTHVSPSYSITAPCVSEVLRMRRSGCSGMTLNSTKRICEGMGGERDVWWFLRSHAFNPLRFRRSLLSAAVLNRRSCFSFSSSVSKGSTASRLVVPGSRMKQPRIANVPVCFAFPLRVTDCDMLGGRKACTGVDSKSTPDILHTFQ